MQSLFQAAPDQNIQRKRQGFIKMDMPRCYCHQEATRKYKEFSGCFKRRAEIRSRFCLWGRFLRGSPGTEWSSGFCYFKRVWGNLYIRKCGKTKVLLEKKDIHLKKAILCCKAHHSRRSHLYYSMVFPKIEILVHPVVVDGISREDWYKTAEGRKVVLGEFSRMGQQLLMMEGRIAWD